MRNKIRITKGTIPYVLMWAFINFQFLFISRFETKVFLNGFFFSIIVVFMQLKQVRVVCSRGYFTALSFYTLFFCYHAQIEYFTRFLNNIFFISIIYFILLLDDKPIERFLKSIQYALLLIIPLFVFNYDAVLNYQGMAWGGRINVNAFGVCFSAGLIFVLCFSWEKVKLIRGSMVGGLIVSTMSGGAIITALMSCIIWSVLRFSRRIKNYLPLLFIIGSICLISIVSFEFLSVTDWASNGYVLNDKARSSFLVTKLLILSNLFSEFKSASLVEWLLGIGYQKVGDVGSDYEYTMLVIELLYKYGLVGISLYFYVIYRILKRLITLEQYSELLIFLWGNIMFFFGAGLNAPSIYMVAFWIVFYRYDSFLGLSSREKYAYITHYT